QTLYRTTGSSEPAQGGALEWNLSIEPSPRRAWGTLRAERLPLALLLPMLPSVPWESPDKTKIALDLRVQVESKDELRFEGSMSLDNGALSSPRIASGLVWPISFGLRGSGSWFPSARRLEMKELSIGLGNAEARFAGSAELAPGRYHVTLGATLPL